MTFLWFVPIIFKIVHKKIILECMSWTNIKRRSMGIWINKSKTSEEIKEKTSHPIIRSRGGFARMGFILPSMGTSTPWKLSENIQKRWIIMGYGEVPVVVAF